MQAVTENHSIISRFFEEGFNRGVPGVFSEIVAPGARSHDPFPVEEQGPDAYALRASMWRAAFPDLHITVEDTLQEWDRTAVRWQARGTHNGDLAGFAPTGKTVTFTGITIFSITAHRIGESWTELDMLGILQQIGAVSALRKGARAMAAVE